VTHRVAARCRRAATCPADLVDAASCVDDAEAAPAPPPPTTLTTPTTPGAETVPTDIVQLHPLQVGNWLPILKCNQVLRKGIE